MMPTEKPSCNPIRSLAHAMAHGPINPPNPAKVKRMPRIEFVATITTDPRQIVLRDRHAIILGRFDALHTRPSLELLNDHDPQVLRVQSEERDLGRYAGCDGAIGRASQWVRIGKRGSRRAQAPANPAAQVALAGVDRREPRP